MSYRVGVDLGTTYSSAAVARRGTGARSSHSATAPPSSPRWCWPATTVACWSARRPRPAAATEPGHVAREFKRRLGDPSPISLGSVALPADALMAALLPPDPRDGGGPGGRSARRGRHHPSRQLGPVPTRPAPPGAGGPPPSRPLTMLTEPEAAAIHYAGHRAHRTGPGRRRLRPRRRHVRRRPAAASKCGGRRARARRTIGAPTSRSSAGRRASTASAASTSTRRCWPTSTASWAVRSTRWT